MHESQLMGGWPVGYFNSKRRSWGGWGRLSSIAGVVESNQGTPDSFNPSTLNRSTTPPLPVAHVGYPKKFQTYILLLSPKILERQTTDHDTICTLGRQFKIWKKWTIILSVTQLCRWGSEEGLLDKIWQEEEKLVKNSTCPWWSM